MPALLPAVTALLAFVFVGLSVHTIRQRRKHQVTLGDHGHGALQRAMRAHGNFAEYVPLALGLLWVLAMPLHLPEIAGGLAVLLLVARLSHAYGILVAEPAQNRFLYRVAGMAGTFTTISIAAALLLVYSF